MGKPQASGLTPAIEAEMALYFKDHPNDARLAGVGDSLQNRLHLRTRGMARRRYTAYKAKHPNETPDILGRGESMRRSANERGHVRRPKISEANRAHSATLSDEERSAMTAAATDATRQKLAAMTNDEKRERVSPAREGREKQLISLSANERKQTMWAARIERIKMYGKDKAERRKRAVELAAPMIAQLILQHKTKAEILKILGIPRNIYTQAFALAKAQYDLPDNDQRSIDLWLHNPAFRKRGEAAAQRVGQDPKVREKRRQNARRQHADRRERGKEKK